MLHHSLNVVHVHVTHCVPMAGQGLWDVLGHKKGRTNEIRGKKRINRYQSHPVVAKSNNKVWAINRQTELQFLKSMKKG